MVAEDVAAQKNGIVCIFSKNNSSTSSPILLMSLSAGHGARDSWSDNVDINKAGPNFQIKPFRYAMEGLPVNITDLHFCLPDEPKYKIVVALLLVFFGKKTRARARSHLDAGSSIIETMYSLQNFGIVDFPLTHTGKVKTKDMRDFITARTAIDMLRQEWCKLRMLATGTMATFTTDEPPGVECPELNCVIFGSSKKVQTPQRKHRLS